MHENPHLRPLRLFVSNSGYKFLAGLSEVATGITKFPSVLTTRGARLFTRSVSMTFTHAFFNSLLRLTNGGQRLKGLLSRHPSHAPFQAGSALLGDGVDAAKFQDSKTCHFAHDQTRLVGQHQVPAPQQPSTEMIESHAHTNGVWIMLLSTQGWPHDS